MLHWNLEHLYEHGFSIDKKSCLYVWDIPFAVLEKCPYMEKLRVLKNCSLSQEEVWQLTSSQILTTRILLELEGLGWTSPQTISSQGAAEGWKRRAG